MAIQDGGRIISPNKPTSTHSYWKTNLHLPTLNRKQAIRMSRDVGLAQKLFFPPTSAHSYGTQTYIYSQLTDNEQ